MPPLKPLLLILLPVAAAVAATTQVSTEKPVINFSTTTWTPDNHRSWLLRASEARRGPDRIDVKELTLAIFPGKADNEKVETVILSPTATVLPAGSVVTGQDTIRVINDQFEATGSDWRYEHREKKVSIHKNVRVILRVELNGFLK
jgi:lipopolysaccharide export system protein LptC